MVAGHKCINSHRCTCGWEGDDIFIHVTDVINEHNQRHLFSPTGERLIRRDVDPGVFYSAVEADKQKALRQLRGEEGPHDAWDDILDDLIWSVRFEAIWLRENGPWVPDL